MESMTFKEIYTQLLEGKRLTLSFPSPESAESFRIRMTKYKTAQEDLFEVVDMKVGSEEKLFSFKRLTSLLSHNVYQFQFREKLAETHYEVLSVETPAEI